MRWKEYVKKYQLQKRHRTQMNKTDKWTLKKRSIGKLCMVSIENLNTSITNIEEEMNKKKHMNTHGKKTYIQIGIQKTEITARKKRSTNRVKLSNRSCSFLLSTLNLSWIECNRERQTAAQSFVVIAHPWYTQHKTKRSNEQRREEQKKNEHSIR